jgi:hypothetical protein
MYTQSLRVIMRQRGNLISIYDLMQLDPTFCAASARSLASAISVSSFLMILILSFLAFTCKERDVTGVNKMCDTKCSLPICIEYTMNSINLKKSLTCLQPRALREQELLRLKIYTNGYRTADNKSLILFNFANLPFFGSDTKAFQLWMNHNS